MRNLLLCLISLVSLILAVTVADITITNVVVDDSYVTFHHTEKYKLLDTNIIVRRGIPITFHVSLSDDLPSDKTFLVHTQSDKVHLMSSSSSSGVGSHSAQLNVSSPSDCPIGNFTLTISLDSSSYVLSKPLVILFNPYNQADDVYFPTQSKLDEYLLNDYGLVYRGSTNDYSSTKWFYGQFQPETLTVAMFLLTQYTGDASDVRSLSRYLTYASTYQTQNRRGILWGNWGSSFAGGKAPWYWQGSDEIFRTYIQQQYAPVKFGQCWVFGGVLNALLRTLGIPSRHLTTFESAHESPDANGKYTHEIAMIYDSNGRLIQRKGSIWNFHSWNDAWFNRPDVNGANGWQAVDATPQEMSGGLMQMGPAPLISVKNFDDSAPFDTPFVISEVSAKIHNYVQRCDSSGNNCNLDDMGIDPDQHAGTLIVSNPVDNVFDITVDYKQPDHIALSRIPKKLKKIWRVTEGDDDVSMFIEATNEKGFGKPIRVTGMVFGSGDSEDVVEADIHCYYTDYTGNIYDNFKNFSFTAHLTAANNYTDAFDHEISDFLYDTPIDTNFFFTMYAVVQSTGDILADSSSLALSTPSLTITAPPVVHIKESPSFTVTFTNPLPVSLTNSFVRVRTPEMGDDVIISVGTVPSNGQININRQLFPSSDSLGDQAIMATLFCDQIDYLDGYASVQVIP